MKRFLLGCFIFCNVLKVSAQDQNCAQKLRLATSIYDQGRLHELEGLLKPCIDNGGFSTSEKVQAYKFLVLAYIYLEEPEKADATMLSLLKTDSYFEVNDQVDPAEFKALYTTFRTSEIFRLGIKLGGNIAQPNISSSNNVAQGTYKYTPGYGFSASIAAEIPLSRISKRLALAPEIQLQLSGFRNKRTFNDSSTNYKAVTSTNYKVSYVCLPILAQYELGNKNLMNNKNRKIRPYLTGGISADYLLSTSYSGSESRQGHEAVEVSGGSKSAMKSVNMNVVLGAGIRWRLAGGFLVAEARYKYGFSQLNVKSQTYSDQNQIFGTKEAPPLTHINAFTLSVGYVQNFFSPKKLKVRK